MTEIFFKEESYNIIGACMKVHQKLGSGFLEKVYAEALENEFKIASIPYEKEKKLKIIYDGKPMNKTYRADFVCYNSIILELKSTAFLGYHDKRQLLNYLKATNHTLGILINFGESSLKYLRIINL